MCVCVCRKRETETNMNRFNMWKNTTGHLYALNGNHISYKTIFLCSWLCGFSLCMHSAAHFLLTPRGSQTKERFLIIHVNFIFLRQDQDDTLVCKWVSLMWKNTSNNNMLFLIEWQYILFEFQVTTNLKSSIIHKNCTSN